LSRGRGAVKTDQVTDEIRGSEYTLIRQGIRREIVGFVTAVNRPRVAILVLSWYGRDGDNGRDKGNEGEQLGMHCCGVERDSKTNEVVRRA